MDDFRDEFKTYLREKDKSANTISSYAADVTQFLTAAGSDPVTTETIRAYADGLLSKGMTVRSVNRKLASIKQYVDFLNEVHGAQIMVRVKQLKVQDRNYLEDMITERDFDSLVRSAERTGDIRAKAIFCTLYYTGMRVSELLQLQVKDIGQSTITIRGKGSKHRDVFVSKRLQKVWKEYVKARESTAPELFVGIRGPITRQTVDGIIKAHAGRIRLKTSRAHAHNFRHLFCKTMIDRGQSIDTVADLAGHSDINTTRIYTRKTKKELLDAIENL